jgi:hypothetical protein
MRSAVLNLRRDPVANAAMAGVFAQQNSAELRERLGRSPTSGELYIAHFLGPAGAGRLISHAQGSPSTSAADLFPSAAAANRSIFYDRQGRTRSAADVYRVLVGKFEAARQKTQAIAALMPSPPLPPGSPARALAYTAAPDPAGTIDAFAGLSAVPVARTGGSAKAFHCSTPRACADRSHRSSALCGAARMPILGRPPRCARCCGRLSSRMPAPIRATMTEMADAPSAACSAGRRPETVC